MGAIHNYHWNSMCDTCNSEPVCFDADNDVKKCAYYKMSEEEKSRIKKEEIKKHEEEIRANERRKFAEWFKQSNYYLCYSDTIDDVLAEYEKE